MAIRHRLLRDQIVDSLRRSILTGQLEPGERLVELELARRFETSQGPVREALQRLATEGLVVLKRHSGTYVAPLNHHELRAICEVRKTVECVGAAASAREMDEEQLQHLDRTLAEMYAAAGKGDRSSLIALDMSFHRFICEGSRLPTLIRVWDILANQIERFLHIDHPKHFPDQMEIARSHEPIVRALKARDAEAASLAVREHIDLIWRRIESVGDNVADH